MFKSNQTLFFKYFGKNYENINEIAETLKNEDYNSKCDLWEDAFWAPSPQQIIN